MSKRVGEMLKPTLDDALEHGYTQFQVIATSSDSLEHYGVKGMKWGKRKARKTTGSLKSKSKSVAQAKLAGKEDAGRRYSYYKKAHETNSKTPVRNSDGTYSIPGDEGLSGSMTYDDLVSVLQIRLDAYEYSLKKSQEELENLKENAPSSNSTQKEKREYQAKTMELEAWISDRQGAIKGIQEQIQALKNLK